MGFDGNEITASARTSSQPFQGICDNITVPCTMFNLIERDAWRDARPVARESIKVKKFSDDDTSDIHIRTFGDSQRYRKKLFAFKRLTFKASNKYIKLRTTIEYNMLQYVL